MKEPVDKEFATSKQKIQNAAIELFAKKGYAGTTTSAIAKAACVNEAAIFKIFNSKKALLYDVYLMMTPVADNIDPAALSYGERMKDDFVLLLKSYLIQHISHMPVYRLSLQLQDEIYERELYYAAFDRIRKLIAQFIGYLNSLGQTGKIAALDFDALAEFMFSLLLIRAQELSLVGGNAIDETHAMEQVERFAEAYANEVEFILRMR